MWDWRRFGESDPLALKKTLQQIARSSQSAAHMVNQLLAMARAEDQGIAAQHQIVNLARSAGQRARARWFTATRCCCAS